MAANTLNPCPFCTTSDALVGHKPDAAWRVTCNGCGSQGPPAATRELAVIAWNARNGPQRGETVSIPVIDLNNLRGRDDA